MTRVFLAAFLWVILTPPAGAMEWVPTARLDTFAGEYALQGKSSSFGANASWAVSPALKFSEENMLVPTVMGQYRRTYEAREMVGGSFLTHETLNNALHFKWIHVANDSYLVKPYFAYKNELIAEAADEGLMEGLFNYHKYSGGIEVERLGESLRSLRHLFSFYAVRFYHFKALTAERFGTEVASGEDVLDFNSYDYTVSADWTPWERGLVSSWLRGSFRSFSDQNLLTIEGTYKDKGRSDLAWAGDVGLRQHLPGWRLGKVSFEPTVGGHAGFSGLNSNQDHYDAGWLKFSKDYYDYYTVTSGFFARLRMGRLGTAISYDFDRKEYNQRLVRAENGVYGDDETVYTNSHTFTYGLTCEVHPHLTLKVQGSYRMGSSNMRFERTYRYNYHTRHIFAGVGLTY